MESEYRQFQLGASFAGPAGLDHSISHFSVKVLYKGCSFTMWTRPRFELPSTKNPYTKPRAEPAGNNKATVTHQLSNAVLEKEHTALPCYASKVLDTLVTCIRS